MCQRGIQILNIMHTSKPPQKLCSDFIKVVQIPNGETHWTVSVPAVAHCRLRGQKVCGDEERDEAWGV